jgi:hypothetical protein
MKLSALALRKVVLLSQLLTNDLQERVVNRSRQVNNAGVLGARSVTTSPDGDDTDLALDALTDQNGFVFISVDSVEHDIKASCQDLIGCLSGEELLNHSHRAVGVYLSDSLGKERCF